MSFFSKLFGRNKGRDAAAVEAPTARHRRADEEPAVPGMRPAPEGVEYAERPLFRDGANQEFAGNPAGYGASVDPSGAPRIGFPSGPSTSGGGFAPDPYAGHNPSGVPRQEAVNMAGPTPCPRCGNQNPAAARFCSNCGTALRGGVLPEGAAETTSTISISGLESYDPNTTTGTGATPALSAEVLAAIDALPPGSALLIVQRGPNSGSRFLLDSDKTTAGRHPQGEIFLDDVTVSRKHVEFRRTPGGGFTVADVGSLNGTYVNRERIDEVALNNGDEVQIGKYRLVFFASHHRGY
ncbi:MULTISPECIES: FHA domain-containing protein [unclassified Kitasatospora]|uniref:FHA domain-containing protein n=1 Tax=unclassified Kitasatospora TaxID=2633591 RepID=UPI001AE0AE40|nr:FHA domain-containing protein [Kitasatospora sp. RG8]MBP0450962.1 FHA domain-containing protein [Kitasatospora sp. RG8]